ncbi:MAG: M1 family aminopeptidase [Rhodospirillales bacterium]|nr:M1 family aminopeptidase [Rhodospirillales bacterium]MCW9040726.1 M1 family aminopeptidase [Rhodospirillales bacterium]
MTIRGLTFSILIAFFVTLGFGKAMAVEAVHHKLSVALNPETGAITATDTISLRGGGLVPFRLRPDLFVTELQINGRNASPLGRKGEWLINLPEAGRHEIAITYAGTIPPIPEDGRNAGGDAASGPDGAYLPPGAGWYPEFDVPTFTYEISTVVPHPYKAVAAGKLVEEAQGKNAWRASFRMEQPVDGIVLLAGPYSVQSRMHNGILLRTYFHAEISEMSGEYLDLAAGYLDRYREWIGDYPFPAFHIIAAPMPLGLGFPGLTYIGAGVLRLPFIRHTSLGHEVLHNWWGNGVFPDYRSGNWSEGLTTFMADYTYALDAGGPEKVMEMRLGWLRDYAALPPERDHPVSSFVSKTHDASQVVGYNKVAFIFHMLRKTIGNEAFDTAIRRFWTNHAFRTAGWNDLQAAFEAAAGRRLDVFFRQWIDRKGAPQLMLDEAHAEGVGNSHSVRLSLSQPAPAYDIEVPVRIETTAGDETFVMRMDGEQAEASFQTTGRPLRVSIDPDFDLFRKLSPEEAPPIIRDVTLSERAEGIILADSEAQIETAKALIERMMDTRPNILAAAPDVLPDGPLIVVGTRSRVSAFLTRHGLPPSPSEIRGNGTAEVWATRRAIGASTAPMVIVAADTMESLRSLLRPLPHYGRQGYLAFEGGRVSVKGTAAPESGALSRGLE